MRCNNCNNEVADDLVFCTECGSRLHETISETPTVLMRDSVATQNQIEPPKPKSNLKWFVLLAALIALPISIFGIYLLLNLQKQPVVQNVNKPKSPTSAPTKKVNANQTNANVNTNVNSENTNLNTDQTNSNANVVDSPPIQTIIWKERIEISPDSHYAVPFEMSEDGDILGTVKAVEGSPIVGYVYTQQQYDDNFPNETFKVFSISGEKKAEVKQRLLKENYVLIFVNNGESSLIIEGEFKIQSK